MRKWCKSDVVTYESATEDATPSIEISSLSGCCVAFELLAKDRIVFFQFDVRLLTLFAFDPAEGWPEEPNKVKDLADLLNFTRNWQEIE